MSGLVLAGGESRRMGRDKALITLDGEPLAARAVRLLSGVCDDVVVASGDGHRLDSLGLAQVADTVPGTGPLAGIVAGLQAARHPLVAVIAVDMPGASPGVLELLAALWGGEAAVVPCAEGRWEPLHAVYARRAAPALRSFLEDGRRSVKEALSEAGVRLVERDRWEVADPSGAFARNLNTPEDLAHDQIGA
jgi:molybdopterin-guanine dinucleotide biosynthesis protein A